MTVAVAVLAAVLAASAADAPLPEGNAYVRGLAARQRQRAEVLDTYTYDLVSVREDLDGKGRVTRRRTQAYETFFVGGRPVRRLVSEDGRPLDGKQRARADREVEDRVILRAICSPEGTLVLERVQPNRLGRYTFPNRV